MWPTDTGPCARWSRRSLASYCGSRLVATYAHIEIIDMPTAQRVSRPIERGHVVQSISGDHRSARVAFSTAGVAEETKVETTKEDELKEVELKEVGVQELEVEEVEVIELPVVQRALIGSGTISCATF